MCLALLTLASFACSDGADDQPTMAPTTPELRAASFGLSAQILGPAQSDDDADLRITLTETNGVGARLNSLLLTCSNGTTRQWGAGRITAQRGSNRIAGGAQLIVAFRYFCPSSGRPRRLRADLTDDNGFSHHVETSPFHPDWPGA